MRGGLTAAGPALVRTLDPLQAALDPLLDARLERETLRPVALGLSGGGDSLALLHLAAGWCARARRPLLALTVDHGLSRESAGWTAHAGAMAARAGAAWRPLAWTGAKPSTGLPAAARAARHALLADAAREAGAVVILLAHTADDDAETEALRLADAPSIGHLREWAPSPAWPQGRGVFLLRPLLAASRAELRVWLTARGLAWLDDPANADPRFARARLRAQGVAAPAVFKEDPAPAFGEALATGCVSLPRRLVRADPAGRRVLAAALSCAAGAPGPPRGRALDALIGRLAEGGSSATSKSVTSTLGGARVQAQDGTVTVGRDLGRRAPTDARLSDDGASVVWDGRFEAWASRPGWRIGASRGRASRLPDADLAELHRLPAALRGAYPVFVHDDGAVRLQPSDGALHALVPTRFDGAVGRIASEADLASRAPARVERRAAEADRARTSPSS